MLNEWRSPYFHFQVPEEDSMFDSSPRQETRTPLAKLRQWWRKHAQLNADLADLACCGAAEVDRMARDLGMSASELRVLAGHGPGAAELLSRRMAALRIDPKDVPIVDAFMLRDMQRLCTICTSRSQCARELADRSDDLARNWQDYCPNAATLNMLVALGSCRTEPSP
jgi:hypothetical protein